MTFARSPPHASPDRTKGSTLLLGRLIDYARTALAVGLCLPACADSGRPLFNGRDLDDWVWVSADPLVEKSEVFSVVDGNIRCAGAPFGYLRTEERFTSFVLTLQIRHLTEGNGGVFVRVQAPDKIWPRAIEAQGQSGALGDIWNLDDFPMETEPARTNGANTARLFPSCPSVPSANGTTTGSSSTANSSPWR